MKNFQFIKNQHKPRKRKVLYLKDDLDDKSSSENKSKNNSSKKSEEKRLEMIYITNIIITP